MLRGTRADLTDIVNEVTSICDLSSNVAKLSKDTIKEGVLLS
jgi:hypothetical protein